MLSCCSSIFKFFLLEQKMPEKSTGRLILGLDSYSDHYGRSTCTQTPVILVPLQSVDLHSDWTYTRTTTVCYLVFNEVYHKDILPALWREAGFNVYWVGSTVGLDVGLALLSCNWCRMFLLISHSHPFVWRGPSFIRAIVSSLHEKWTLPSGFR